MQLMYPRFGEFVFPGFQRRRLLPLANVVPSGHRSVTVTKFELSFHLYRQNSSDRRVPVASANGQMGFDVTPLTTLISEISNAYCVLFCWNETVGLR